MMAESLYEHTNAESAAMSIPTTDLFFYDHMCACVHDPRTANVCPLQLLLKSAHPVWKMPAG